MWLFLLPLVLVMIFLLLSCVFHIKGLSERIVISVLAFSVLLLVLSELASLFEVINAHVLRVIWLVIFFILFAFVIYICKIFYAKLANQWKKMVAKFSSLVLLDKLMLIFIVALIVVEFVIAYIFPPNNWDAMTYRLPRIIHWVEQQSLSPFSTHIMRQLYQPPFSEIMLMNIWLIGSSFKILNLIQWFYQLAVIAGILVISNMLNFNGRQKIISVIVLLTLPLFVLQSTNSHNDIVASFYILSTVYFALKMLKSMLWFDSIFFAISLGIAILTKGTSYVILFPVVLLVAFSFTRGFIKTRNLKFIGITFLIISVICIINVGQIMRNVDRTDNFMGIEVEQEQLIFNEAMSLPRFVSNSLKNTAMQMSPFPINRLGYHMAYEFDKWMNLKLNDPQFHFQGIHFIGSQRIPNNEEHAANPVQFFLLLLALMIGFLRLFKYRNKYYHTTWQILFILSLQLIIMPLLFKWHPWMARLYLPILVISVPFVVSILSFNVLQWKFLHGMLIPAILISVFVLIFNDTRPIVNTYFTTPISIFDTQTDKTYANIPMLQMEYEEVKDVIIASGFSTVALQNSENDLVFPLYNGIFQEQYRLIPIFVKNSSAKYSKINKYKFDAIVSTQINEEFVEVNNTLYFNRTPKNKRIFLYY